MRKRFVFTFVVLLVFLFGTVVGSTAGYSQKITVWFNDIKINLDGTRLGFYSQPFTYNGQVYVSLNDLANNMGLGVQWDDQNKTMNLSSNANNRFSVNTLQQQLDQKNLEIANLKFQLSQKNLQLDIYKENNTTSSSSSSKLRDLEKRLEDKYDKHRNNSRTLGFDDYYLTQQSNGNISVSMYGDFDRTSSYWENRSKSTFDDFIEDICKEIDKDFNEDIEITVYDKDKDRVAEYKYDDSRDKLSEEYTYGSSSNSSDDDKIRDLERKLIRDYDEHKNNGRTLIFKDYDLTKYSDEIRVKIYAKFDRTDSEWKYRDKEDFRKFIENVCKEIDYEFNDDIKVYVYDKDNDETARYTYDDSDNRIKNTYDYEY